ncbi:toll/interleukin-1 receptor domain-containing protein [Mycobacterium sp. ITM-2016-00316]|uniref:toll/interleukin-1 receptor domain-containing protein n=1 Tax=Mycobacterium sp. ITM-2016-00316 TaxID=2099695 RepID=UPI00287F8FB8|nr:toll/interleukin-1 receptor domain-containing protein [Mycobacterium sp. ITM-2016-00316]WNG81130.1 toll/interleukin-1 receptor domain-containing protein [Mycobacterium sp. ITM-2016-00316]
MRDYFLSYASEDRIRADQLVEALEGLSAQCFIDHRDIAPGDERYRDRLIEGIGDCECIVVLLSSYSQASDEVFREMQAAHDRGRRRIAVWLDGRTKYTNGSLEMLLASSQDLVWGPESAAQIAQRIHAMGTVSSLRDALADYQSVVSRLEVDLSAVFAAVDRQDLTGAVASVCQIAIAILRQLWSGYQLPAPPPDEMQDLILGCRDHFEYQSLVAAFATIQDLARHASVRPASMDSTTKIIDQLMSILSVLRVRGHEKVLSGGQVEVPAGGQIEVPTPCSSCRSGTVGPDGDGEGANQTPPPGSSIEVCEGPHGHHFRLPTSRVVPRCCRPLPHHPQDRQTDREEVRSRR